MKRKIGNSWGVWGSYTWPPGMEIPRGWGWGSNNGRTICGGGGVWIFSGITQYKLHSFNIQDNWSMRGFLVTPLKDFQNHLYSQPVVSCGVLIMFIFITRVHTVLKKSLNFKGSPWKVLEFHSSLKSPWIFFNFECSCLERIFWCFLVVQDRI